MAHRTHSRLPAPRASSGLASRHLSLRHWWDVARAADPDLARWRMGLRPVLAVGLTTALMAAFASVAHVPLPVLLVGISLSMMATFQANDPTPEAQRVTLALLVLPAALCLGLGMVLAEVPWMSQLGLVAVCFAAVYIRRFGPRGLALGMIGWMSYFFALFFHAPLAALPVMLASVVVGLAVAYAVRFRLVPDNDAKSLRWGLAVLPGAIGTALETMADAIGRPGWDARQRKAVDRALKRVNQVGLAIDAHLNEAAMQGLAPGLTPAELRGRIFEVELALDRIAARVAARAMRGLPPARRRVVACTLTASAGRVRRGEPAELCADTSPALAALVGDLHAALAGLLRPGTGECPAESADVGAGPQPPVVGALQPATRQAIQAAIAVGLSIVAGVLLSPTRWYWAVIGAYIMFIKATSLGETLVRGWHRVLGTAAGVGAGIVLASAITGHEALEFSVVLLSIFLGFYLIRVFYAGLVFGITLVLAALYAMMGRFTPGLMVLRLEETLLGCAIGALVATVVLRAPTHEKARLAAADLLRRLADLLHDATVARGTGTLERMRQVDRSLQILHEASQPLTGGLFGVVDHQHREEVHLLDAAVFCARQLARAPLGPQAPETLAEASQRVEANARAIAEALEDGDRAPEVSPPPSAVEDELPPVPTSTEGLRISMYWLNRVDDALLQLGHTLPEHPSS